MSVETALMWKITIAWKMPYSFPPGLVPSGINSDITTPLAQIWKKAIMRRETAMEEILGGITPAETGRINIKIAAIVIVTQEGT
jgi:hypothetical protein